MSYPLSLSLISPPVPVEILQDKFFISPSKSSLKLGYAHQFSLVSLSSFILRRHPGVKINILADDNLSLDEIFLKLKAGRPAVVGISPTFWNYSNALEIARYAKKMGCVVILGGNYATALAREIILNRGPSSGDYCVDAIVRQDGEEAIEKIISGEPFYRIPNLVYQDNKGIAFNKIKLLLDLDELPIPDFSLVFQKGTPVYFMPVFSRRGCSWRVKKRACLFCMLMQKNLRYKSPFHFYKEMIFLIKNYQPEIIFDVSDNFLDNLKWLREFASLYKNYFPKPEFQCYSRVDSFTSEKINILCSIGARSIVFGVESNDDKILKSFGKGYSPLHNYRLIKLLRTSDLSARFNFVIGGIGESRHSLEETLAFIKLSQRRLFRLHFSARLIRPYPGSEVFRLLVRKTGLKYRNRDELDYRSMTKDWFKHFCRISFEEAEKFIEKIDYLKKEYYAKKIKV